MNGSVVRRRNIPTPHTPKHAPNMSLARIHQQIVNYGPHPNPQAPNLSLGCLARVRIVGERATLVRIGCEKATLVRIGCEKVTLASGVLHVNGSVVRRRNMSPMGMPINSADRYVTCRGELSLSLFAPANLVSPGPFPLGSVLQNQHVDLRVVRQPFFRAKRDGSVVIRRDMSPMGMPISRADRYVT